MDLPDGFFEKAAAEAERAYENSWRKLHSNWRPDWREVADVVVDVLTDHWENQTPWSKENSELKAKVVYLQKILDDMEALNIPEQIGKLAKERDELQVKCDSYKRSFAARIERDAEAANNRQAYVERARENLSAACKENVELKAVIDKARAILNESMTK